MGEVIALPVPRVYSRNCPSCGFIVPQFALDMGVTENRTCPHCHGRKLSEFRAKSFAPNPHTLSAFMKKELGVET